MLCLVVWKKLQCVSGVCVLCMHASMLIGVTDKDKTEGEYQMENMISLWLMKCSCILPLCSSCNINIFVLSHLVNENAHSSHRNLVIKYLCSAHQYNVFAMKKKGRWQNHFVKVIINKNNTVRRSNMVIIVVTPRPAKIGLYGHLTLNNGDHERVHQLQKDAHDCIPTLEFVLWFWNHVKSQ